MRKLAGYSVKSSTEANAGWLKFWWRAMTAPGHSNHKNAGETNKWASHGWLSMFAPCENLRSLGKMWIETEGSNPRFRHVSACRTRKKYVCIPKSWLLPARYEFNHLQLKVAVFNEKIHLTTKKTVAKWLKFVFQALCHDAWGVNMGLTTMDAHGSPSKIIPLRQNLWVFLPPNHGIQPLQMMPGVSH